MEWVITLLWNGIRTRDYAAADRTTIRDEIKGEFQSLGLEYAPGMGAARGLLRL